MRKLILGVAVSLDGFIEDANGKYDWCFSDQDYGMSDFFKTIDSIFIGRKSYELTAKMNQGGGQFSKMKEYVFSRTLTAVKKPAILISDKIKEKVTEVKNEKGKNIWLFGGASLTSSLMNLGLVDEIWLAVHPVILGGGKSLFNNIDKRIKLGLLNSKIYSTDLVSLTYAVKNK